MSVALRPSADHRAEPGSCAFLGGLRLAVFRSNRLILQHSSNSSRFSRGSKGSRLARRSHSRLNAEGASAWNIPRPVGNRLPPPSSPGSRRRSPSCGARPRTTTPSGPDRTSGSSRTTGRSARWTALVRSGKVALPGDQARLRDGRDPQRRPRAVPAALPRSRVRRVDAPLRTPRRQRDARGASAAARTGATNGRQGSRERSRHELPCCGWALQDSNLGATGYEPGALPLS